jgi:hypothetical protein
LRRVVATVVMAVCGFSRLASAQPVPDLDPRITNLVSQVSEERLVLMLKKLKASARATRSRRSMRRHTASARRASGFSTR